jgi:glycogen operon protein
MLDLFRCACIEAARLWRRGETGMKGLKGGAIALAAVSVGAFAVLATWEPFFASAANLPESRVYKAEIIRDKFGVPHIYGTTDADTAFGVAMAHAEDDFFTLQDVVSYNHKHNLANGEHNRDGHHANFSTNCGVEGPSTDPVVLAHRARLVRAMLACTLLAQGTPMLLAGDELGHGQRGNNNAYCQDNAISWIDWAHADAALIDYAARLVRLRRDHLALRQDHWLADGQGPDAAPDARWLAPDAELWREMTVDDWHDNRRHALGLWLSPPKGVAVLIWLNAEPAPLRCALPPGHWTLAIDSSRAPVDAQPAGAAIEVPPQAVLVLVGEGAT